MRPRSVLLLLALAAALAVLRWAPWSGPPTRPASRTLLLLTIDTLRRDRVGAYGAAGLGRGTLTPNLDRLAAEGVLFEDARSPVPLTLPAHATMLSGLPPAQTGVRLNTYGRLPGPSARGYPLLPERLRAAGWRTAAFVSASPLAGSYGLDQGFELYDAEGLADETGLAYAERPGKVTVVRALAWLAEREESERVFLWVHLFEPHAPYAPDAPATLPPTARYEMDVARADAVTGLLVDGLAAAGRGDFAALVTSDHGEALDELGEQTHGLLLGDAVLRVPFLLRAPTRLEAGRRADPVDLADVAATLAALAGLPETPVPPSPGSGHSLLDRPAAADRVRVAESLYAHHLHGWAQLLAAVAPDGSTLVETGAGRLHWLDAAPFLEPQAGPRAVERQPGRARLGEALRAYRQGERPERIRSGGVAAGYGHAARVAPFLPPAENAALPDPYAVIDRHWALDRLKERLFGGVPPTQVLEALSRLRDQDPRDPEVHFWVGRAHQAAARAGGPEADRALAAAEAAYGKAWERGRQDASTLALFAGVNSVGREAAMLDRLDRLAPDLPPDCQLLVLRIRLLRALGRGEEADEVCAEAREVCRSPREQRLLEAGETCR